MQDNEGCDLFVLSVPVVAFQDEFMALNEDLREFFMSNDRYGRMEFMIRLSLYFTMMRLFVINYKFVWICTELL